MAKLAGPVIEVFAPQEAGDADGVQFRIYATEEASYVEHNRALFVLRKDGLIQAIDLYCSEPLFSAHRKDYVAPATLADDEVTAFLEESLARLGCAGVDAAEPLAQ